MLLIAILLLAGCAGDQAAPSNEPARSDGAVQTPSAAHLVAARFPLASVVDKTVWANGTFQPQQAQRIPNVPTRRPDATIAASVDVTELAVSGLPVILEATLESTMAQGRARTSLTASPNEVRTVAATTPVGGRHHFELGIVRNTSEPILLNAIYDTFDSPQEIPYVLSASVHADPTIVRSGFPVGLTVSGNVREILVDVLGERRHWASDDLDTPNLMLWAPDDAFIGHVSLTSSRSRIPLTAGEGEYVLLLNQGGRSLRILVDGSEAPTLRALPQTNHVSDPHPGTTATAAAWTTTYLRVPTVVGVLIQPTTVATNVTVRLESPLKVLIDTASEGRWINLPEVPDNRLTSVIGRDSSYGMPGLAAGEYHARIATEGAVGAKPIRAQDTASFWER